MRITLAFILATTALPAGAAEPQQQPAEAPSPQPINQRDASAVDVVATPAGDLNLRKNEIPQVLIDAEIAPYELRGMRRCPQISAAITRIDAVLGEDIDVAQAPDRKLKAGKAAQSLIGSFIPFRGLIREISGASGQERRLQSAIFAGTARRSFLKGVGLQRGCPWPARSATPQMLAQIAADNEAKALADDERRAKDGKRQQ
jgi:hypothetical protein